MKTQPGQRQIQQGREFKDNTGSSPNGVANSFLSSLRGKKVAVLIDDGEYTGVLIGFDSFSIKLEDLDGPYLIFKGPGMIVRQEIPQ